MNQSRHKIRPLVVGIGEVLWDIFSDGPKFGGAPANFACSAAGLGSGMIDAALVSAVGRDDLGSRALAVLRDHGVDATRVTESDDPTGQVIVRLDNDGKPDYEIATGAAWDRLSVSADMDNLARRVDAVCFGTLGQRSTVSRSVIRQFVSTTRDDCIRILDVNLRPPFWSDELILESMGLASMLKCNDTELPVIASLLHVTGSDVAVLQKLIVRYSLELAALTRGSDGSLLVSATGAVSEVSGSSVSVVDTVGAGDAFTAALTLGLVHGAGIPETHKWAGRVAGFVCSQPGATTSISHDLRLSELVP